LSFWEQGRPTDEFFVADKGAFAGIEIAKGFEGVRVILERPLAPRLERIFDGFAQR